jgi:hypothetical protein
MKKKLIIVLVIILMLVTTWFGTVWLQKPPAYPTAQGEIGDYFDHYRMDYSVPKAGLIEDVDALVAYTDELHADPYRVIDRAAFLAKADEVKSKIKAYEKDEVPVQDAFYLLQELAASIQDGHTTIYPQNWEKSIESLFPLVLTSVEGSLFVERDYGNTGIPERAEILSVDGIPVSRMQAEMLKYVPGTLPHLKQARFAELFPLFIQTYYKMPSPWQVTYKHNGVVSTGEVQGIPQEAFEKATMARPEFEAGEVRVDDTIVPVLELPFSGMGDSEWEEFKAFIDGFFARNIDSPYLVIDVRHHLGGDGDWGVYTLSYLSTKLAGYKEFSFKTSPLHQRIIRYGFESAYYDMKIPRFLWGLPIYRLAEQDDPSYWIGRGVLESQPGTYYDARWEDNASYLVDPSQARFHGKVYLLTSHETFSAGVYLAGLFRENHLGPIIGRETGGRVYMESNMLPVFLPHSNLMYLIPVAKFVVCGGDPDRGVIPDITVDLTVEDYLNHRDMDMEKVIELITADRASANGE